MDKDPAASGDPASRWLEVLGDASARSRFLRELEVQAIQSSTPADLARRYRRGEISPLRGPLRTV